MNGWVDIKFYYDVIRIFWLVIFFDLIQWTQTESVLKRNKAKTQSLYIKTPPKYKKKCFEKEGTQVDGQFYFHTIIYISQQRYVTYCNNPQGTKMKSSITCSTSQRVVVLVSNKISDAIYKFKSLSCSRTKSFFTTGESIK